MKIKDVIGECLLKIGETNFVDETSYSDEQQATINKLLGALNIAYREIVTSYLPLVHKQKATLKDGKIKASELEKSIVYPISVKQDGEKMSFYTDSTCIFCNGDGEVEIKYAYVPSKAFVLADSVDDMRLTISVMSDATLAEYYFQEKVFELAKSFDTDFRAQISLLRYKGRNLRVKRRGWHA